MSATNRRPHRVRWLALALSPLIVAGSLAVTGSAAQAAEWTPGYAYVHANKPSEPAGSSYTPFQDRNHNTSGSLNIVTRHGVGRYTVWMPDLAPEPEANLGVSHVTAHGDTASYCAVDATYRTWVDGPKPGEITYIAVSVRVHCFGATGEHADSEFTASWTNAAVANGGLSDIAYLTATDERASHEPPADLQFNSSGHSNKVGYLGRGRYRVRLNGMGDKGLDPKAEKGHVQVTGYQKEAHRCKVAYFVTLAESTQVDVNCHSHDGVPSDSRFTLTYVRDTNLVGNPWGAYTWVQGKEQHPDEQWTYPDDSPSTTVDHGVGPEEGRAWVSTPMNGFMDKGNVQVSAEGPGPHHCKVARWDPDNGIQVRCFDGQYEPVRNPFFVSFAL